MTGSLAQLISLASYGNEFLRSGHLPKDYFPESTVFQYDNAVTFFDFKKPFLSKKFPKINVAENPNKWFEYLKQAGCDKIRLYFQPSEGEQGADDYKLAGMVGGGGLWLIETIYDDYSDFWTNDWKVTKERDPESKIWSVTYEATYKKQQSIDIQIDLHETYSLLDSSLQEIANFAFEKNFSNWGNTFDAARNVLRSETPSGGYYKKGLLVEKNYSLITRQILCASVSAWVFGGMGSWNDLYFENREDDQLYNRVSKKLYSSINQGILAAVNMY